MLRPTCALLATAVLALSTGCTETDDELAAKTAAANQNAAPATVNTTACAAPKVLICHIPPGNPQNALDICIAQSAVQTHIDNHGDFVGSCNPGSPPPPPPVCQPFGAPCTTDAQCCSNACSNDECFDHT